MRSLRVFLLQMMINMAHELFGVFGIVYPHFCGYVLVFRSSPGLIYINFS